ncbi:MAG: AAA family ATPase [Marinilabiliaceae bacterium]|nr:AAA family ATPase [Marinilabiliaceae bacterium]
MEIKIRNFGPVSNGYNENEGFLPLAPVTVFCGPQSTGKSCVAKLLSTLSWIEKALVRGDFNVAYISKYNRFVKYCSNQNIHKYFSPNTEIHYRGTAYNLIYKDSKFQVIENKDKSQYKRPQISYIPAERNLLSSIEHVENLKNLPTTLSWTREDFYRALQNQKEALDLPIENVQLVYNKSNKIASIQPKKDGNYRIHLSESSSGIQSVTPFFVVLKSLSQNIGNKETTVSLKESDVINKRVMEILQDDSITPETRRMLIEKVNDSSNKVLFAVVEEPEQNLYPLSQRNVLFELLKINNMHEGSHLLITTHSPFILDYLTLAIKARQVATRTSKESLCADVDAIVPHGAWTEGENVIVYQIDNNGNITALPKYDGMPSDSNRLNEMLVETNDMFNALMDIEERCKK